jgi:uncharacterized protein YdeI (YjbR/CyaY-like superfamily)
MYKKATGIESVNHPEALDEALCYGWIDGQSKSYDEESWLQKFTPRRKKSLWSKRNIEHIERLRKAGKMTQAGEKEVEAAKADGRWAAAYDGPATIKMPEDFLKELAKDKKAEAFFNTLNKTNIYAIAWRLQTAVKPETRERRFNKLLEMLKKGEKIH